MKKRLAEKIIGQQVENFQPKHKRSRYWFTRWFSFELYCCFNKNGKADHRIIKAISLTSKKKKKV